MRGNIEKTIEIHPNYPINTVLNGLWQLSGGHGKIDPHKALQAMKKYHENGLITWDLADHYGFAEDLVGMYNNSMQEEVSAPKFFTKWVPPPGRMNRRIVETAIDRSLQRMKVKKIEMMQFHWWDYSDENYLIALEILNDLREEGKIRHLSLTNFDTHHMKKIVDHGIPIVSNQIQFSVLDQRPLVKMVPYCEKNGIHLFAYGTLGGGLYTERFYNQNSPRYTKLNTSSLQKYFGMVRSWGTWEQFQGLLGVLHELAIKYEVSMANIAMRWVLEQPAVAGVIIGTRLSLSDHIQDTLNIYSFQLGKQDQQRIQEAYRKGNDLFKIIGDCGDEYR